MPTDTYTSSDTWVCPSGVTSVDVECWGGGGGGGGINGIPTTAGGGGGGAYSKKLSISVTPASSYTVTVGAGGTGGAADGNNNGSVGGDSWFSTSGTVLAKGGGGGPFVFDDGDSSDVGPNAAGGASGSGIGDTKYSGGSRSGQVLGGCSSAGTGSNGTQGENANGGVAPTGGGDGGWRSVGVAPGGGGSGGHTGGTSHRAGWAGAAGQIKITYVDPPIEEEADSTLTLTSDVVVNVTREFSLSNDIVDLDHEVSEEVSKGVSNSLDLAHDLVANLVRDISLSDSLNLTDDAIPGASLEEDLEQSLSLTHVATGNVVINQSLSNDLEVSQAVEPVLIVGHVNFSESGTWLCPPGVASVTVEAWGGGGGSGAQRVSGGGSGGGAGGGFSRKLISVTEGVTYTVTVGAGGTGSTSGFDNAGAGGDSWFSTSGTVLAKGGNPGTSDDYDEGIIYGSGGTTGSQISAGIGDTKYRGGNGGVGYGNRGGSSGGTAANGLDGFPSGGSPPTGAGAGGASNTNGSVPGGGAGGRSGSIGAGYIGAAGYITLIYVQPYQMDSDLTVSQQLTITVDHIRELDNDLTLTQDIEIDDASIYKYDALALTEDLVATVVRSFEFEDTLSLGEDAVPGAITFEVHEHTIGVGDTLDMDAVFSQEHSDSLTLSHILIMNIIKDISFSDSIGVAQAQSERNLSIGRIYQDIAFGHSASSRNLALATLTQSIGVDQSLRWSPHFDSFTDALAFTQTVYHNLVQHSFIHTLELSHSVVINCERTFDFTDTLEFTNEAYKTAREAVEHSLSLSQVLARIDEIKSTLTLSHSLTLEQGKLLTQIIGIAGVLQTNLVLGRSLSHTLALGQSAIAIVNNHETCTYNPISSVLPGAPTLTKATNVTYTCGLSSLVLRAPAIGDTEDQVFQKILRESSGGSLIGYRQSSWPKSKTLNYTFNNLDCDQHEEIVAFLRSSLGLQVTLVDYWGRTWVGVITNPDSTYVDDSRTTSTVTIRFQGVIT